jgi:hypothetical protein
MTMILTGLLLPALSAAKEKAHRAVCQNNLHQLYMAVDMYAGNNPNGDYLPSAADNLGQYHSIRLSDETFTNLAETYAGGCTGIFYCPNVDMSGATANGPIHDQYGYVIGYSYLASDVQGGKPGVDYAIVPVKFSSGDPTNALLADANYWSLAENASIPLMRMAPHTGSGGAMAQGAPTGGATNSAGIGAMGGNIAFYNGAVSWRPIKAMQTYAASSVQDAYGSR